MGRLQIRTDRPFGLTSGGAHQSLNLEGQTEVLVDESIALHATMARRWSRRFERLTGIKPKKIDPVTKTPFSRDAIAKRVKAATMGSTKGWQEATVKPDGTIDVSSEKEVGGEHWYNDREEMGKYAESIGIDLDAVEKAVAKRTKLMLIQPRSEEPDLEVTPEGVELVRARRTAFNATSNPDAVAIDYMHEFQFQISEAGQLSALIGQQVDIPAGSATLQVPRIGYAQVYKQGALTTEAYQVVPAVEPTTASTTWVPFKLMLSMWATGEFDEDSIAPWIPAMERSAQFGRGIALDHLLLRGHTATGAGLNINAYGGALTLGANDPRLAADGFYGQNYNGTLGGGAAGVFKGVDLKGAPANLNMVPAIRGKLGKYGIDASKLTLIVGLNTRMQMEQDLKARPDTYQFVKMDNGEIYAVSGVRVLTLADSQITNANAAGMPNYAGWNLEGSPNNLNTAGLYDGAVTANTAAVLVNGSNYLQANKRRFNWLVVRLPLADQVAVVGSERFDVRPIHPNVSEAVIYGLQS